MVGRKYIDFFNPGVEKLRAEHQDFLFEFDAGIEFANFNTFISSEAIDYAMSGDGVTYLVFNYINNTDKNKSKKELMAFYTIATTSIPYVDRIRIEPDEVKKYGKEYDETICGIPSVEIKMFAVDKKYQDTFYEFEGECLPISAWIMKKIISNCVDMLTNSIGFKAIFLHSVPSAEEFYLKNGFHNAEEYMVPLYSVDNEFQAMYMSLKYVHINRD